MAADFLQRDHSAPGNYLYRKISLTVRNVCGLTLLAGNLKCQYSRRKDWLAYSYGWLFVAVSFMAFMNILPPVSVVCFRLPLTL